MKKNFKLSIALITGIALTTLFTPSVFAGQEYVGGGTGSTGGSSCGYVWSGGVGYVWKC